jgi:hypothetical protein
MDATHQLRLPVVARLQAIVVPHVESTLGEVLPELRHADRVDVRVADEQSHRARR